MPQQSAPRIIGDGDPAEAAAVHVRYAVVAGEPLVEERVVGGEQIDHAAVFAHDALEEQLRLTEERLPQRIVEIGELVRVGKDALHVPKLEPLPGEVRHERP